MRHTFLFSSTTATLLVVGCSGSDRASVENSAYPTAPTAASMVAARSAAAIADSSVPDVNGRWNVAFAGRFTVPDSVVQRLFGVEPEGPITHLRCAGSFTMELVQSGTTFSGLATRTAGSCETGAGIVFVPPPTTWMTTLPIAEGLITGRGVHFLFGSVAGLGCPHNGAITAVDEGRATELRAAGRCIIPGHPQSPAPLDPPPLGTSHDTTFVATRP